MTKKNILYTVTILAIRFTSLMATEAIDIDIPFYDLNNQSRGLLHHHGNIRVVFTEQDKSEEKSFLVFKQKNKKTIINHLRGEGYDVDFKYTTSSNYVRLFDQLQTMRKQTEHKCREFIDLKNELDQSLEHIQEYIPLLRHYNYENVYSILNDISPIILEITQEIRLPSLRDRSTKNTMIAYFNDPLYRAGGCQLDELGTSASNFAKLYLILEAEKLLIEDFDKKILKAKKNIKEKNNIETINNLNNTPLRNIQTQLRENGEQLIMLNYRINELKSRARS